MNYSHEDSVRLLMRFFNVNPPVDTKNLKSLYRAGMKRYNICYSCSGTGGIELHNPVIPKGRLL